jgi:hypothetical protein
LDIHLDSRDPAISFNVIRFDDSESSMMEGSAPEAMSSIINEKLSGKLSSPRDYHLIGKSLLSDFDKPTRTIKSASLGSKRSARDTLDETPTRVTEFHSLTKRAPTGWFPPENPPVNCPLQTVLLMNPPVGRNLRLYPPAQYWYVTQPSSAASGPWRVVRVSDPVGSGISDAKGRPYNFLSNEPQTTAKAYVNVDHAFEIKFLRQFFINLMNNTPDCSNFKTFWHGLNPASKKPPPGKLEPGKGIYRWLSKDEGFSRLDTIFKLLAGTYTPFADFLGTDMELNKMKGDLFLEDWLTVPHIKDNWTPDSDAPSDWIVVLNRVGNALEVVHLPEVKATFQSTLIRLYIAFKTIDKITDPCRTELYAQRFKDYMETRFAAQSRRIEALYAEIVSQRVRPGSLQGADLVKWQLLTAAYAPGHYTLKVRDLLRWQEESDEQFVAILKRHLEDLGCVLPSTLSSVVIESTSTDDWPPPSTPQPLPPGQDPNCHAGLYSTPESCSSSCTGGRCEANVGSTYYICFCAPANPLPAPPPASPTPTPPCDGGQYFSLRVCTDHCGGGRCFFTDSDFGGVGYTCHCNGWDASEVAGMDGPGETDGRGDDGDVGDSDSGGGLFLTQNLTSGANGTAVNVTI